MSRVASAPTAAATLATALTWLAAGRRVAAGLLGGDPRLSDAVAHDLAGLLARGAGDALRRYAPDGARLDSELRVHLHAHGPTPRLAIVGANDFSAALAPLARTLGWRVTIVDPRAAFLQAPRFAHAAEVVVGWPQDALAACELGPRDAVLVLSHDPKLDVPALLAALCTDAGYIGALGTRRTTTDRDRRLREGGASDEQLARILAPCGLDIGSATPQESAIAVCAEIIATRSGRSGAPLRATGGPIRPRQDTAGA